MATAKAKATADPMNERLNNQSHSLRINEVAQGGNGSGNWETGELGKMQTFSTSFLMNFQQNVPNVLSWSWMGDGKNCN